MARWLLQTSFILVLLAAAPAGARADTILILPFENVSTRADYNWVGETFSVQMSELLDTPGLVSVGPDERNVAYLRLGLEPGAILARATALKLAEKAGVDLLLIGNYNVGGEGLNPSISITARLINMRESRLVGNEFQRGGLINDLQRLQGELAWTIMYQRNPALPFSRDQIVQRATAVPLSAFQDYVKASLTQAREDKILFLKRAVKEANNNYPAAAYELAYNYYLDNEYDEAIKLLEQVKPDDPHYIESLFYLGVSQLSTNALDNAIKTYTTLLAKLPLYETYNDAAVVYLKKGQPKQALPLLKSAAGVAARDADVQFNYGYGLWLTQDYAGAVDQLQKAVALRQAQKQEDGEAYYLLANSEQHLGKTAEAAAALDKAKKHLTSFAAWETKKKIPMLARLKYSFNKNAFYKLDRSTREVASAVHPATPVEEAMSRARDYFIANRDDDALRELRQVLQAAPDNAEAHLLIGRVYERKGNYPDAINELKAATFWNPKLTSAYVMLGRIYSLQKNCEQAQLYLKKALESDPKDIEAQAFARTLKTICPN